MATFTSPPQTTELSRRVSGRFIPLKTNDSRTPSPCSSAEVAVANSDVEEPGLDVGFCNKAAADMWEHSDSIRKIDAGSAMGRPATTTGQSQPAIVSHHELHKSPEVTRKDIASCCQMFEGDPSSPLTETPPGLKTSDDLIAGLKHLRDGLDADQKEKNDQFEVLEHLCEEVEAVVDLVGAQQSRFFRAQDHTLDFQRLTLMRFDRNELKCDEMERVLQEHEGHIDTLHRARRRGDENMKALEQIFKDLRRRIEVVEDDEGRRFVENLKEKVGMDEVRERMESIEDGLEEVMARIERMGEIVGALDEKCGAGKGKGTTRRRDTVQNHECGEDVNMEGEDDHGYGKAVCWFKGGKRLSTSPARDERKSKRGRPSTAGDDGHT